MRSASAVTTRITCSTSTIVVPCARMRRMRSTAPSISAGVRPDSTSSSSSRRGLRGEPARQLEELDLVQVEVARIGVRARRESGELQPVRRGFVRVMPVERRAAEHGRERDVVADREVRERPRDLVGARDAGTGDPVRGQRKQVDAVETRAAGVGAEVPAHDIDQRRLARSVGADHAEDLACAHVEVDAVERANALERLGDAAHRQQERPLAACAGRACDAASDGIDVCTESVPGPAPMHAERRGHAARRRGRGCLPASAGSPRRGSRRPRPCRRSPGRRPSSRRAGS